MPSSRSLDRVRHLVAEHVVASLEGAEAEVKPPGRWKRPTVLIRWKGFAGLLAEQRFRLVLQRIPQDVLEGGLAGLIWFELAPGETVDDYLKMPRSEDVAQDAPGLVAELKKKGFSEALRQELGRKPTASCKDNFTRSRNVLKGLGFGDGPTADSLLALIHQGAYCDCEALSLTAPDPAKSRRP